MARVDFNADPREARFDYLLSANADLRCQRVDADRASREIRTGCVIIPDFRLRDRGDEAVRAHGGQTRAKAIPCLPVHATHLDQLEHGHLGR